MKSLILIALLSTQVLAVNKYPRATQPSTCRTQSCVIVESNITTLMGHQVSAKQYKEMKRTIKSLLQASKQVAKAVK